MTSLSVVPLAKETYDRKDEQNFREWTRRNLQAGGGGTTTEMQAQLDQLQTDLDNLTTATAAMLAQVLTINNTTKHITFDTGIPTTGTFERGDKKFKSNAANNQPIGWVCTVAGTPGTWAVEGTLGAEAGLQSQLSSLLLTVGGIIIEFKPINFGYAPPTTGTYAQGDIMYNAAAAVGQPEGWRCIVAGTPGTWVSEGNLGGEASLQTQINALNTVMVVHAATIDEVDFIFHAPAPPTTGPHAQGERVFNSLPSIGQPKSWLCTASGTPGTWVSEGNL